MQVFQKFCFDIWVYLILQNTMTVEACSLVNLIHLEIFFFRMLVLQLLSRGEVDDS